MKITLIVVGKTTDKRINDLVGEYAARVGHYIPFDIEVIPELKNTKALSEQQQKDGDWLVLLDEGGKEFRSVEFSNYIQKRQQTVPRRMVFLVGGPYGFAPSIYAKANEKISLSRMTFSHQMVRLFFVEQLYRAMTIMRGEPYHHE